MPSSRGRLVRWGAVVVALAIIATAVVVGIRWWRDSNTTDLERALSMAPHDGTQLSWTDWAGVRSELDLDLGDDPSDEDVAELLDLGFEADLTQSTALGDSAQQIQDIFGFSPATIDWELFSQSAQGAVVMMHLAESMDIGAITDAIADAGFAEPEEDTGVWVGGDELLAQLGGITPELGHLVVDEDRRLILGSDDQKYLEEAAADARSEDGPSGLEDVVEASGEPLAASIYTGDHACAKLAMSQADPIDQDQATELIRQAGELNPLTGFAISVRPGGDVRVVMSFESDEQAKTNADTRAALASGPAPGEGGDFSDLFELGKVRADGKLVTMELEPVANGYTFSALKDGPVLFATC
jgi:hypothetical protein